MAEDEKKKKKDEDVIDSIPEKDSQPDASAYEDSGDSGRDEGFSFFTSFKNDKPKQDRHEESPEDKRRHQESEEDKKRHQESPEDKARHQPDGGDDSGGVDEKLKKEQLREMREKRKSKKAKKVSKTLFAVIIIGAIGGLYFLFSSGTAEDLGIDTSAIEDLTGSDGPLSLFSESGRALKCVLGDQAACTGGSGEDPTKTTTQEENNDVTIERLEPSTSSTFENRNFFFSIELQNHIEETIEYGIKLEYDPSMNYEGSSLEDESGNTCVDATGELICEGSSTVLPPRTNPTENFDFNAGYGTGDKEITARVTYRTSVDSDLPVKIIEDIPEGRSPAEAISSGGAAKLSLGMPGQPLQEGDAATLSWAVTNNEDKDDGIIKNPIMLLKIPTDLIKLPYDNNGNVDEDNLRRRCSITSHPDNSNWTIIDAREESKEVRMEQIAPEDDGGKIEGDIFYDGIETCNEGSVCIKFTPRGDIKEQTEDEEGNELDPPKRFYDDYIIEEENTFACQVEANEIDSDEREGFILGSLYYHYQREDSTEINVEDGYEEDVSYEEEELSSDGESWRIPDISKDSTREESFDFECQVSDASYCRINLIELEQDAARFYAGRVFTWISRPLAGSVIPGIKSLGVTVWIDDNKVLDNRCTDKRHTGLGGLLRDETKFRETWSAINDYPDPEDEGGANFRVSEGETVEIKTKITAYADSECTDSKSYAELGGGRLRAHYDAKCIEGDWDGEDHDCPNVEEPTGNVVRGFLTTTILKSILNII